MGAAVNITLAAGDSVTVARSEAGIISVSGTGLTATNCGGATVSNRDTVNITGAGGNESVTIDLSGGAFEPGVVNEPGATDEIEFAVDLGAGAGDSLTITGSSTADLITMGRSGINLNDVDDIDLTTAGVKARVLSGVGGDDVLSAGGGNATGSALAALGHYQRGERCRLDRRWRGRGHLERRRGCRCRSSAGLGSDTVSGGIDNDLFDEGSGRQRLRLVRRRDGSGPGDLCRSRRERGGRRWTARSTTVKSGEGDNVASDVENADGGSEADTIVGSASPNVLTGWRRRRRPRRRSRRRHAGCRQ